jgi:hypothetical protein
MPIHTTDITTAFLYTKLNTPVYVCILQGMFLNMNKLDFSEKLLIDHYNKKERASYKLMGFFMA